MLCCAVVYISFLAPDFIVCFRQFCQWRVRDMSNSSQRENPLRHEFAICCECGTSLASIGFRSRISINFIFIRLIWFCKSHSIIIERNDEKNLLENPNTWNVNGVKCYRLQNTQVYNMVNLCGFRFLGEEGKDSYVEEKVSILTIDCCLHVKSKEKRSFDLVQGRKAIISISFNNLLDSCSVCHK